MPALCLELCAQDPFVTKDPFHTSSENCLVGPRLGLMSSPRCHSRDRTSSGRRMKCEGVAKLSFKFLLFLGLGNSKFQLDLRTSIRLNKCDDEWQRSWNGKGECNVHCSSARKEGSQSARKWSVPCVRWRGLSIWEREKCGWKSQCEQLINCSEKIPSCTRNSSQAAAQLRSWICMQKCRHADWAQLIRDVFFFFLLQNFDWLFAQHTSASWCNLAV